MTLNFLPVPAGNKIIGRNDNAYLAAPSTYEQQKAFMEEIKTYAIEMEQKYGVPAAVIGGMAGLESGHGFTRTGFYANQSSLWKMLTSPFFHFTLKQYKGTLPCRNLKSLHHR